MDSGVRFASQWQPAELVGCEIYEDGFEEGWDFITMGRVVTRLVHRVFIRLNEFSGSQRKVRLPRKIEGINR